MQEENPEKYQEAWAALKEVDGTGPTTISQHNQTATFTQLVHLFTHTFSMANECIYFPEPIFISTFASSCCRRGNYFHLTLRRVLFSVVVVETVIGMVVPGGFGNRGVEGKLLAANYARVNKKPMLGVCLGMQVMVMEYARYDQKPRTGLMKMENWVSLGPVWIEGRASG